MAVRYRKTTKAKAKRQQHQRLRLQQRPIKMPQPQQPRQLLVTTETFYELLNIAVCSIDRGLTVRSFDYLQALFLVHPRHFA